ncbi:retrovirus-related pol polyprotein from transposon TNT 1-94 [Tanacetum coccineum]
MHDDIPTKVSKATRIPNYHVNTAELQGYILYELKAILNGFGKFVTEFGLQAPPQHLLKDLKNKLLMEEKNYKRDLLMQEVIHSVPKLNHDEKKIYDLIINASDTNQQELLFVYGHVASSGIASMLLPAGRTTHSRFKLPLELTNESLCHAKKKSQLGNGEIGEPDEEENKTALGLQFHLNIMNSNVKRALFTTPIAAKSKNLRATSIVEKSRLSVAKTPIATNKVSSALPLSPDSSQSKTLSNYMKNKIATSRKWQKCGCLKHMTGNLQLLRNFIEKFMGIVRFGNDHFTVITGYGDYAQEGDDLLTGSCDSNLYTISIFEMAASSPVCLMSRATSIKSWLWHYMLSHLNFGTINQLTSKDLVDELPRFKYNKDHLCSACEQGKGKKASLSPKLVPST